MLWVPGAKVASVESTDLPELCSGRSGRKSGARTRLAGTVFGAPEGHQLHQPSEGGMIRLETLIELKFLYSSFSSLSSYWN